MSQVLLPPPSQPPEPPRPEAVALAPPATAPTGTANSVMVAAPPSYGPESPHRRSAFSRAAKWPIRQLLKAIYLAGSAANRHRAAALIVLAAVVVLGGGAYGVYHYTHPDSTTSPGRTAVGPLGGGADTPFTISSTALPPLSPAVIQFLHAWKTYNSQELLASLSPQAQVDSSLFRGQQSVTASEWQSTLAVIKGQGIVFQQFLYTGGYLSPDGTANHTVQVVIGQRGSSSIGLLTWYFLVGPDGRIAIWRDLTPAR